MRNFDKSFSTVGKKLAGVEGLIQSKRFRDAQAELEKLRPAFDAKPLSSEAAYFHYLKGHVFWELGDKKLGFVATQRALEIYLVLRDLDGIAKSQKLAGALLIDLGNLTLAKEHLELAVSTFKLSKQWGQAARALNQMAYLYVVQGKLKYANDYNAEARRCAVEANDKYYETILQGSLSWHQFLGGDWKQAKANITPFLVATKKAVDYGNYALGLVNLGHIEFLAGHLKEARKHYFEAIKFCTDENLISTLQIAYEHLAELSIADNNYPEAEGFLKKALEIGERITPYGTKMTQCWRLMGDLYNAKGEPVKSLKAYETCESYLIKLPEELERGACFVGRGVAYAKLQQWNLSCDCFEKALDVFDQCENEWETAKAVVTSVEAGGYSAKQITLQLLAAKELFQKLEHPAWEERVEKLLSHTNAHPDALPLAAQKLNLEKEAILSALQETNGNITLAAQKLGLLRSTLQHKIKRYRITL
jgi:tetratricopeptide (TPR) repeat protein